MFLLRLFIGGIGAKSFGVWRPRGRCCGPARSMRALFTSVHTWHGCGCAQPRTRPFTYHEGGDVVRCLSMSWTLHAVYVIALLETRPAQAGTLHELLPNHHDENRHMCCALTFGSSIAASLANSRLCTFTYVYTWAQWKSWGCTMYMFFLVMSGIWSMHGLIHTSLEYSILLMKQLVHPREELRHAPFSLIPLDSLSLFPWLYSRSSTLYIFSVQSYKVAILKWQVLRA